MDMLVFSIFLLLACAPLGCGILQFHLLRRWRGGWRVAAAAPVLTGLAWAGYLVLDASLHPGTHDGTIPLEILDGTIAAAAGLGYLAALSGARGLIRAGRSAPAAMLSRALPRSPPGATAH